MAKESIFLKRKRATERWLAGASKGGLKKFNQPDENIALLLQNLNRLPFLYTEDSCGGHIRTKREVLKLLGVTDEASLNEAGDEFDDYSGAWLSFTVDDSSAGKRFVERLRRKANMWNGATLMQIPHCDNTFILIITSGERNERLISTIDEAKLQILETKKRIKRLVILVRKFLSSN